MPESLTDLKPDKSLLLLELAPVYHVTNGASDELLDIVGASRDRTVAGRSDAEESERTRHRPSRSHPGVAPRGTASTEGNDS